MGLGKTIQTLAHILTEKEAGRLTAPALVVCPTSLVANWRHEAERFAPGLRVLTLHGPDRAQRFDQIAGADLVLTTYALLTRDTETLLPTQWHLVVLDEAQAIKNPASKAAQLSARLLASHRLCLTGTPIENHLGELWSQMSFLVPGLLGDHRRFGRVFRTPIEKQGDEARRDLLTRRIRPFLLRRTKGEVEADLPAKTEILRRVELAGEQRDLYETVRLAMHERVRQEIASKGFARSQIIILDALLKLRQVCCDPRLVKLTAAKRVAGSAKLAQLMEMLPELIEDGRRVLLFSQFTSMLDLIRPEVEHAGLAFVELRGDTADRATPVARFQAGEVPLVPDQPEGRRRRPEPDRRRHGDPLRPVVEPGGRGAGDGPRAPDRPGQAGLRLQADRRGHDRGADAGAAGAQAGAGRRACLARPAASSPPSARPTSRPCSSR